MEDILKTKVMKVIFSSPKNNWKVIAVDNTFKDSTLFKDDTIVVTGNFDNIYTNCSIEIKGDVKNNPTYGNQIECTFYKIIRDNTNKESICNFLCKSSIKGISAQNAMKIYEKYKENSIEVTIHNTDELSLIKGIGKKTIDKIKSSVQKYIEMEELLNYGIDLGFTYNIINKIYDVLGKEAVKTLKENIYSVLDFTEDISFKQIDNVAINNGIDLEDKNRVKACFLYTLRIRVMNDSSTGCAYPELTKYILKELGINNNRLVQNTLNILEEDNKVYLENNKVYYKEYYDTERAIADYIIDIVNRKTTFKIDKDIIENEIKNFPFEMNKEQVNAINNSLNSEIAIITGVGGSGKTSILKALVNIYIRNDYNVVCLSPTGIASRRLSQCTGRDAFTIHKYLGTLQDETIENNTVILVDESSMMDILIFRQLLNSFNSDTRLVLIGDIKQLPSVSVGNVLEDLMTFKSICVTELTDIMRQAKDSNIIAFCDKVNKGKTLEECNLSDFYYKEFNDDNKLIANFTQLYLKELEANSLDDIQVITPYHKGVIGNTLLNKDLSNLINDNEEDEKFGFKVNDKVMQIKNNYKKDIFNGEVGLVEAISDDIMKVSFQDNVIDYEIEDINELIKAFCSTTHKVQGQEYPITFILIPSDNTFLLTRTLLYTALSRARKKVYLLAKEGSVDCCIENIFFKRRITKLGIFLQESNYNV